MVALVIGALGATAAQASTEDLPSESAAQRQGQQDGGSGPEANLGLLFGVYIVTWGGFFGYVFIMSRRQREMRREIDALRGIIEERRETEGAGW